VPDSVAGSWRVCPLAVSVFKVDHASLVEDA
jgi:hypothetical protein